MTSTSGAAATSSDTLARAGSAFDIVGEWMFGDAMQRLLTMFGTSVPNSTTDAVIDGPESTWMALREELPSWLDEVMDGSLEPVGRLDLPHLRVLLRTLAIESRVADDFDFRGQGSRGQYRERAQASQADFDAATREQILSLADELGLVAPNPPRRDAYDSTLILGGGYRSPLLRSRLAAQIASAGTDLGEIYSLGSPRFLIADPPEAAVVAQYATDPRDEFDLMCAGAAHEFGFDVGATEFICGCASAEVICPQWSFHDDPAAHDTPPEYTHLRKAALIDGSGSHRGAVLSAHTSRPPYRPDTSDTYELLTRVAQPHPGQTTLIVTTQVFVPFQRFDGLRRLWLHHGVEIDAVGFGEAWGDRPLTAEYVLQETLSAIRSARRLLVDAAELLRTAA